MDALTQDIRFALRMLMKSKAFTLFTITTLALGIGTNTALFTVINGVLLRPLPFADAEQLLDVPSKADEPFPASEPNLRDWQSQSRLLAGITGYTPTSVNLIGRGEAERVQGTAAGDAFFRVLGVAAARGRTWREADPADNGVVLSDQLWRRRFGSDPAIVGRDVIINGAARPVIGVMPSSFRLGDAELWLRLPPNPQARRGNFNLRVVARHAPNV
ncbi:MAG: ABC transporter permease [Gemmatimonadota bacterium]